MRNEPAQLVVTMGLERLVHNLRDSGLTEDQVKKVIGRVAGDAAEAAAARAWERFADRASLSGVHINSPF